MSKDQKQVTWGGRFSEQPDVLMQVFGESVSFDMRLAVYDLKGSLGHASMLAHVGLLSDVEFQSIEKGIQELFEEVKNDSFPWKLELEDVHMNLEQALRSKTEAADKLHTGNLDQQPCARLVSRTSALDTASLADNCPGHGHSRAPETSTNKAVRSWSR